MRMRLLSVLGGGLVLLAAAPAPRAAAVQPCPGDQNCAAVSIEAPSVPAAVGDTVLIRFVLVQGSDDQQPGGVDDIAAVTATVGIPGLQLADCSARGADGLNPSFVLLPGDANRYRVVVQNLICAGRASCLCPTNGEARDEYINLLLVGTPVAGQVPALPSGELIGVALLVGADDGASVPLHIYSVLDDQGAPPRPLAGAWLSVADSNAVDRTVDPASATMNVRITDGTLMVAASTPSPGGSPTVDPIPSATATLLATATTSASATVATFTPTVPPPACVGDCNDNRDISVNELVTGVGIALGSLPLSACPAFECAAGQVNISCLVAGVDAALNGCPATR